MNKPKINLNEDEKLVSQNGPAVSLSKIHKAWDTTPVLKGLDLEFAPGTFTAILGPSGCGKSTLLRIIAGLEKPTSGDVVIDGRNVTNAPPSQRDIAMVFQNYALFPHLSVSDNILFGLQVRGVSASKQKTQLDKAISLLNLGPHLKKKPNQLSGGQQQRVALARAIVGNRSVFLMDEPLSNLDSKLRAEMREELCQIQKQLGVTMIYVTHDQLEALTMADMVVILNEGEVEQCASPDDTYSKPENLFVASFVGSPEMNFMPARDLLTSDADMPEGLLAGIRPEAITIATDGRWEASIVRREYQGADTVLTLDFNGQKLVVRLSRKIALSDGSKTHFTFNIEDLHLFDPKTGKRADGYLGRFQSLLTPNNTNLLTPNKTNLRNKQ